MSLRSLPQNHPDHKGSYGMALQVAVPTPIQVTLLQVKIPWYLSWASEDPSLPCPNVTSCPTQTHNVIIC